ncbi:OmpA family protein [Primorskyibacter flagellatus]|uniref:Outer membrane protein OmpA n=1 Tax=Primorskyibacter flagellatus TaxID=1387277 RepID=A0A1W2AI74_9RHOB|nr:OmpA family protein [Primorskyibacter flagellatus]SMC60333.1 Outer membrane protein OmpA [Primorskyibacter flagellatus]
MTTITRNRARPLWPFLILAAASVLAMPGKAAIVLDLPTGSRNTAETVVTLDSYRLPIAPWDGTTVPAQRLEGQISRQAFRVGGVGVTTLQILAPLRQQIADQGYDVLFECAAAACGGFDFRFGTEVLPGPAMYVDLTDYRFLAAAAPDQTEHLSLLVSRSAAAGFVQVIRVTAPGADAAPQIGTSAAQPTTTGAVTAPPDAPGDIANSLDSNGHVILTDLIFDTGAAALGTGNFASLEALAAYLRANPDRRIVLVGHTDATGSLEINVALSRRRAASVKDRLVSAYEISASRLDAAGMGYLAPIASNLTDSGREANRRVEAVLLPK